MRQWITGFRYEQSEQILHLDRCWWSLQRHRENKQCRCWGLIACHVTLLLLAQRWNIVFFKFLCLHFFFLALFLQRRILLGKRKCLHSEVNTPPPLLARSPPPTKHTHKHTADGVSVTFQNVKWFGMLWGAFTYLRKTVSSFLMAVYNSGRPFEKNTL